MLRRENEDRESEMSGSIKEYVGSSTGSWEVEGKPILEPVIQTGDLEQRANQLVENPYNKKKYLPFKAALEFLPKEFDGRNIPVRKFIENCQFAADSIDPSESHHLFLIIRSRIRGSAETSLQNQEINNLCDLLNYLKFTFADFKQLGQLNSMLATVAQKFDESVQDYGNRVGEILSQIIDLIKEKNGPESSVGMVKSAREAAAENFIMGLKKGLALRVRLERPKNLLEAIRIAGEAEWEMEFERTLVRGTKDEQTSSFRHKFVPKSRVYSENPRVRLINKKGTKQKKNQKRDDEIIRVEPVIKKEKLENLEIICFSCKKPGHVRNDCKEKYANKKCFSCGEFGHIKSVCSKIKREDTKEFKTNENCQNCGMRNHSTENCRGFCKYCKKGGHVIESCFGLRNKKLYEEQNQENQNSKN